MSECRVKKDMWLEGLVWGREGERERERERERVGGRNDEKNGSDAPAFLDV
jgi:hypothetical protein